MHAETIAPTTVPTRVRPLDLLPTYLRWIFGLTLALVWLFNVLAWLVPQQPMFLRSEAEARAWLRAAATTHPWLVQAHEVGATRLLTSPLYRGMLLLLVGLALVHIVLTVYALVWPRAGGDVPPLSPRAAEEGRFEHLSLPLAEAEAQVARRLVGVRVVAESHPSYQETRYFARGGHTSAWGSVLFFLGIALLALGLYVAATFSWETRPTILVPGDAWDLGHGAGVRVSLLSEREAAARAGDLFLIQREDNATKGRVYTIPVGRSLWLGDVEIRHLDTPPGVRLQATTRTHAAVPLLTPEGHAGRNVVLVFSSSGDEHSVLVPTYGLEIRVVGYDSLPDRGYTGRVFLVQVLAEGQDRPVLTTFITASSRVQVAGMTLQVQVVRPARVQARYAPGRALRWAGLALAVVGLALAVWRRPFRRVWVQLYSHDRTTIVQVWEEHAVLGWTS